MKAQYVTGFGQGLSRPKVGWYTVPTSMRKLLHFHMNAIFGKGSNPSIWATISHGFYFIEDHTFVVISQGFYFTGYNL